MANGDVIQPGVKFIDIRSKYRNDPDWSKVESAYQAGTDPDFYYHRFWAQCDIAIANGTYALLFGTVVPPPTPTPTPTSSFITPTPTTTPTVTVTPATGPLKVFYKNNEINITTNTIRFWTKVSNIGTTPLDLSKVKVRYYFTIDSEQPLNYAIDYSSIPGSNIPVTFIKMATTVTNTDWYMEVGFTTGADSLAVNADTGDIQLRFWKSDWSNFNQSNDYSYNATMIAYGENTKLTGYNNGTFVFGIEPGPGVTPSVLPTASPTATPTATVTTTTVPSISPTATATVTVVPSVSSTATVTTTIVPSVSPTATATTTVIASPTSTVTGALKVLYKNNETATTTNTFRPWFQVQNTGTSPVDLTKVKVRYYFTVDSAQTLNFACDHAVVGASNITGSFVTMSAPTQTADRYFEFGFSSGAGTLAAGASTGEIQFRIWKNDWSNFDQNNDYSFFPRHRECTIMAKRCKKVSSSINCNARAYYRQTNG